MIGQKDPEILVWRGGEVRPNKQWQHGEEEGLEQIHSAFLFSSVWQGLQAGSSNILHLGVIWESPQLLQFLPPCKLARLCKNSMCSAYLQGENLFIGIGKPLLPMCM